MPHPASPPGQDRGNCFEVRGLRRTYGSAGAAVHALRGIDIDIPRGELIVILGASGSGKSTFLNILGGLDRPSAGSVLFEGEEISGASDRALTEYRRRYVGFVFQFYNLMPSLTALENVALVTEIAETPLAPADALALVGLEARAGHFPAQLSGGEQQRVAIARAVAKQPRILLCDEPTGALDLPTGIRVLEALKTVNDNLKATTLLITHNAGIAAMAHRVIEFSDGLVRETYLVSAPQSGRLMRIGNLAGQSIEAGERIGVLLPSQAALLDARGRTDAEAPLMASVAALKAAEALLAEAEAALQLAGLEAGRAETLFARGVRIGAALDRARADPDAARARRAAAAALVAQAGSERRGAALRLRPDRQAPREADIIDICAPVAGRVLRVLQESEAVIVAGMPILEIGGPDDLEIVAEYLSEDAVRIAPGAPVRIEAWGGDTPLEGRVRIVEPSGFRKVSALGIEESRVNVIIDLAGPAVAEDVTRLGDGYQVEVFARVWSGEDVLRVPVAALVREGAGWAVFRENRGRAELTAVEIGPQDRRHAVLVSGPSASDRVILYPGRDIEPGTRIRQRRHSWPLPDIPLLTRQAPLLASPSSLSSGQTRRTHIDVRPRASLQMSGPGPRRTGI